MTTLTRRTVLTAMMTLPFAHLARAASDRVSVGRNGIAMQGYDTHAYWITQSARPGSEAFVVQWRGVPWHFATAQDAEIFRADPDAYAPGFGAFCTRAMSLGKVVDGDPEVWRIHKDKLYLFARPIGGKHFDKGPEAMIAKAQKFWDALD
ncbi:YHS domain-containing (seleno)protein [Sulfitobacter aestuariivivens]|uniref:YHS domain protein n=1 Tax=Sulfitobacter aestuariivivens TaxID=2766981 RepID=A0A927HDF3_9RHOB|nr:YHS domain-containing (seleno)protein [Sulfitobacter aestuariivivens]MBD3662741.1 hypothetical protein [Sulfitobacter aestuariivivens]